METTLSSLMGREKMSKKKLNFFFIDGKQDEVKEE
jgi:hypothetical protein